MRVKPSGAASWLIQYRNAEGRTRRLVLGKLGTLTPHEARDLARDRLSEVAKGKDPSAERHAMREGTTVAELCDLYIKEAEATGRVKSSTLAMDRSRIERHVKPLIGGHSARTLASGELAKLQADIAGGRTAKAQPVQGRGGRTTGGRGVAARTLGMLGTILEYGNGMVLPSLTQRAAWNGFLTASSAAFCPSKKSPADRIGAPGSARIAGKNAIPRHQRRQLVLNHPDRREDGCHSKANCTSSGFESHSTGWEVSIWGIPI